MATGRKTVVVGQVIDPVTWGNPLWDQSVQTFASAVDRTAQFPAPKQGAPSWLEDVKRLEVYNGAAWVAVPFDNAYTHALPAMTAGGTSVSVTAASELGYVHRGFRVSGAVALVTGAAGPAGTWRLILPKPARFKAGQAYAAVGSGWIYNGAAIIVAALNAHTSDPTTAAVMEPGSGFGGYAVAPISGAQLTATLDYETTTVP